MKHYLHNPLRALFLSLAVLLSLPMLAVEVEIDGIRYDLNAEAKRATVIKKSGGKYSGDVVIPETVEFKRTAHSVTSIGDYAFSECDGLTSVTIPNSVTSIGEKAFNKCSGLTSVLISDIAAWCNIDFENYDSNPLYYARHLYLNGEEVKDLVIPNTVTSIGKWAFYKCSGLTSVTIGNSVTSIGYHAFDGCSGLTSVTIGNGVESIEYLAFSYCSKLLDVYCYAEKVPSTGSGAFYDSYPANPTLHVPAASIDSYKATAPWSRFGKIVAIFTEIDGINYDFDAVTKKATVIEKSSGEYSGEVVIPESVEHEGAAYSVTSIGERAFGFCSGLTSVTIPNSVTSIGGWAFCYCYGLTSVTIGNSVTSIEDGAFSGCSGLTSVTIPNSVTSIGDWAFRGCSGLTSVTIPNSVTSIGDEAFRYCSGLTSVTIPNSVTSIGDEAFRGCSGLTSIVVEEGNPVYDSRNNCNAIVETASNSLICGCNTSIIPNSVTSIGDRAFESCSGMTSVTIPNSVTSIGQSAFCHCSGLISVTIGNSVKSIGEAAFGYCSGLTSVTIPNSVTSIGGWAFSHCSGLTSVTIPNSVTSIGVCAFSSCSGLTSVTIPNSVTRIGDVAFWGCSGLTSVTIGNGVTSIGEDAFAACIELLDVYCYAEKVPSTSNDAFDGSYPEYATLHVPDASIDSYKVKSPWSKFGKIVALTEDETGIDELKGENGKVKTEIFDLSGRRVQKAQKGIFIQNGKVVVK